ncbi:metalloregulator ArsR/SmtB family transcription factor [Microvirga sp. SRT01]|jgi:ubiquinone/menaquinone biosynthesis C-methylase UbiE/DNA-binding transcriptional ArsR family regulator|uniref:Metalloregulator ArsR/SmtB family transcription factor n=1 Tax=Sphingomonas longa TaxID=2778730 RepID=A0ABS2D4Q5_9SPHN|nr:MULTISPECIES: metalloregulator ArsR/SmtB family transcription factor [Alphaproteobacteria]MBM6575900.1 metalloregulator ArsR/SmtB family transcription factor [Sphingomonas sp. BT552]MBR7708946.1 metalloregulator ArsR/SmtB family transcription factor [Microvirga sp. SRT01]
MVDPLDIFGALGDATRLRILALLRQMELSVGELAQVLGQSQPRVSRHVKILCDAGLAERRKEGSWVFVVLGRAEIVAPIAAALDTWGQPDSGTDAARLAAVRADRAAAAASWFESHAREWDAIRSLHVAEEQVEAAMQVALGEGDVGTLVDIGTGTGRMLELFAGRAHHALGIDRSSEMLRLARAKLEGVMNAELRQADLYALPVDDEAADVAILHHVLHFAQQPGAAIAEAARALGPGGRLLIADFASHDREELRTRDAHVRLGFSDAQIEGWFETAGLTPARTDVLDGGELTVKLWLGQKPGVHLREVKAA